MIKFAAKLTEVGTEIIDYLQTASILEAAQEFPQYPFLEACSNRYKLEIFPITQFCKEEKTIATEWEHKIKGYEIPLMFILPYLINDEIDFVYASEWGDWKEKVTKISPIQPEINWDRKFKEATGIEI